MNLIVHIAHSHEWDHAKATGTYIPSRFAEDGFIHCSQPEQAHLPANSVFSRQDGLVLLWIDLTRLTAELRYESTDPVSAERFPHLYGPLNVDAVVGVTSLQPWEPGSFVLPPQPM